jgi:hypothetical protein
LHINRNLPIIIRLIRLNLQGQPPCLTSHELLGVHV